MTEGVKTEEPAESLGEYLRYIDHAARNADACLQVLSHAYQAESEAGLLLVRAWYALSCFFAAQKNTDVEWSDKFLDPIDRSDLVFPRQLSPEQWEEDLRMLRAQYAEDPFAGTPDVDLGHERLLTHYDFLDTSLRRLRRALYRKFGEKPYEVRLAIGLAKTIGLIVCLIAIFYGGYLLMRSPGEWRVEYFPNRFLAGSPTKIERNHSIDFNWSSKAPLEGFPRKDFSVRWDSCLEIDQESEIMFKLTSDDGSRLFIDGDSVIDMWSLQPVRSKTASVKLSPGLHHIRVEYFQAWAGARVALKASSDGKRFRPVPESWLVFPGQDIDSSIPCGK